MIAEITNKINMSKYQSDKIGTRLLTDYRRTYLQDHTDRCLKPVKRYNVISNQSYYDIDRGVHRILQRWVRARSARKIFFRTQVRNCFAPTHPLLVFPFFGQTSNFFFAPGCKTASHTSFFAPTPGR